MASNPEHHQYSDEGHWQQPSQLHHEHVESATRTLAQQLTEFTGFLADARQAIEQRNRAEGERPVLDFENFDWANDDHLAGLYQPRIAYRDVYTPVLITASCGIPELHGTGLGHVAVTANSTHIFWSEALIARWLGVQTPTYLTVALHTDEPTRVQAEALHTRRWQPADWGIGAPEFATRYYFDHAGHVGKLASFPRGITDNRPDIDLAVKNLLSLSPGPSTAVGPEPWGRWILQTVVSPLTAGDFELAQTALTLLHRRVEHFIGGSLGLYTF